MDNSCNNLNTMSYVLFMFVQKTSPFIKMHNDITKYLGTWNLKMTQETNTIAWSRNTLFFGTITCIVLFWLITNTEYFQVKRININGKTLSKQDMLKFHNDSNPLNMLFLNQHQFKQTVANLFGLGTITIHKNFPKTLNIDFKPSQILFYLIMDVEKQKPIVSAVSVSGKTLVQTTNNQMLSTNVAPVIFWHRTIQTKTNSLEELKQHDKLAKNLILNLGLLRHNKVQWFRRMKEIHVHDNPKKNYLYLRACKTRFFFGKTLSTVTITQIFIAEQKIGKIGFTSVRSKFGRMIAEL